MKTLIAAYIEDRRLAWSASTLKSELPRLNAVADALDGNAQTLWDFLIRRGTSPYARVTTWSRVKGFWDYLIEAGHEKGPNPYQTFRRKYGKQFKNTYARKTPEVSFEEALRRIQEIQAGDVRDAALTLLRNGLRAHELGRLESDGVVQGKGGKRRATFGELVVPSHRSVTYRRLRAGLSSVGLLPHDLRKIFANELVRKGADPFQLLSLMGWSSLETARSYVEARRDDCRKLVEAVNGTEEKGLSQGV